MAQDEGCFGRISRPTRCWAPPGIRPHAPYQVVREYMYVYAAVAPAQGEMTSLILPSADTAMMTLFLEHVSQTFAKYFIVMQVDGAGWHHSDELVIPSNIRLIEQPPYSPEVNPVKSRPPIHSLRLIPCCLRRHIYSQRRRILCVRYCSTSLPKVIVAEDNLAEARLFFGFCFGVTKCATAHNLLRSAFQREPCLDSKPRAVATGA